MLLSTSVIILLKKNKNTIANNEQVSNIQRIIKLIFFLLIL